MAMERGGRASKLGNSYERLWAVRQALSVLQGSSQSLLWEPLGDDEPGVDLWVTDSDGTRTATQLKRDNGAKEYWSVADLQKEGVLKHAKEHLQRDGRTRFEFVSSCGARHLRDLAEMSARANSDPDEFYLHQVSVSQERLKAFRELMSGWSLDHQRESDRAIAFGYLQRMEFTVTERERQGRREVEWIAGLILDGEPLQAVDVLGSLLDENIGTTLHADQLRILLGARGVRVRTLAGDPNLSVAIQRLQRRFSDAIAREFISSAPIARPEVDELLSHLQAETPPRLVLVHGDAGSGKTVVLQQAYLALQDSSTLCLPIQLHIRPPEGSPRHYGQTKLELPASPALSLRGLGGGRPAVLILDQLDALRLTSSHSHAAWEACAEVIDEALADSGTTVVLACRTFDLENDPMISSWRHNHDGSQANKAAVVKVGELPEDGVAALLQQKGVKFQDLSLRQRRLLRQPATLAIWWRLAEAHLAPHEFATAAELMNRYLKMRREEASRERGATADDVDDVLSRLVQKMDREGQLSVHESIVSNRTAAVAALCSVGLLVREDKRLSFAHQGFFDHILAERVLADATESGRDILDWVRTNQSLFRREQLRQLLILLRDLDPKQHETLLRDMLLGPNWASSFFRWMPEAIRQRSPGFIRHRNIRFHLKHLVVGLLSQADPPTNYELRLGADLAEHADWWEHFFSTVMWQKQAWFDALDQGGHLQRWLASWTSEDRLRTILWFLRSVMADRPEATDRLLSPYWRAGGAWPGLLDAMTTADPSDDSPGIFRFRLQRIRLGQWGLHAVFMKRVAEQRPERVVPLLDSLCLAWLDRVLVCMQEGGHDVPRWVLGRHNLDSEVLAAVKANADDGWQAFSRFRRTLVTIKRLSRRRASQPFNLRPPSIALGVAIDDAIESAEALTQAAAAGLAADDPEQMQHLLETLSTPKLRGLEHALAAGLACGADSLADVAIGWLCKRPSRFHIGDGHDELYWTPATRIIQRYGQVCSEAVFRSLEATILCYYDEWEFKSFKYQYEALKGGCLRGNDWGKAQHHLLNALPSDRISPQTRERMATWRSKFGDPAEELPPRAHMRFGRVASPIPPDRLTRITDQHWLRIIEGNWDERDLRGHAGAHAPFVEASVSQFSDDLGTVARKNPERFAQLALKMPPTANPAYFEAILRAISDENPPDNSTDWVPASTEAIEAFVEHVGSCADQAYAMSVCRLVTSRRDARWSDALVRRVLGYASHREPEDGHFTMYSSTGRENAMMPDVGGTAINCVRGVAASAITQLLWSSSERLSRLMPTIQALLCDPHVSVRHEALGACLPLWNHDRDCAIQMLLLGCGHPDDRVLESYWLQRFIGYARWTHLDQLRQLIVRMARSPIDSVAQHGATWATACHHQQKALTRTYKMCRRGTPAQRKGVAGTLQDLFGSERHSAAIARDLVGAFHDDDADVRHTASRVFYRDGVFAHAATPHMATEFIASPAFQDDPQALLHPLSESTANLRQYAPAVFKATDRITGSMAEATRDMSQRVGLVGSDLSTLLLRLYEQAYNREPKIQESCLDRWDRMLQNRVGTTTALLKQIDG